jgi:hypothetical protein
MPPGARHRRAAEQRMSFEERFAAVGRAIDGLFERLRMRRSPRPYRSRASNMTVGERFAAWRHQRGANAGSLADAARDWRRGMSSAGARRLNVAMIFLAMLLTAGATWLWTTWQSTGLTKDEVQALSTLVREQNASQPAPASGPWWNQGTSGTK